MGGSSDDRTPTAEHDAQLPGGPFSPNGAELAAGIRVLAVDSRPLVLGALGTLIESQRPHMSLVGPADSYGRALYLAERLQPDVVLLGICADALGPLDAVSLLSRRARSRVLVWKGMHDPVPVARLLRMGASGVVIAEDPTDTIVRAIFEVHVVPTHPSAQGATAPAWRRGESNALWRLTERERELIRAMVAQPSAKYLAIGARLGISEHTVHNHLTSIYHKLNVVNRTDMLLYAVRHGLVLDDPSPRDALS